VGFDVYRHDHGDAVTVEEKVFPAARMVLGESRVIVLEILDRVFKENIGISLFEGVQRVGPSIKQEKKKGTFQQEA
jgi:hypothetical protein